LELVYNSWIRGQRWQPTRTNFSWNTKA